MITTVSGTNKPNETNELTPLRDRLALLLVIRLFMASVVLLAPVMLKALPLHHDAITAARIYVGFALGCEIALRLLQRLTNRRWLWLVNLMLIVDGLFVAAVMTASKQSQSPFLFLAYVHIVSVTLLIGFRTGLKIALWHSILLLVDYYLALAGMLHAWGFTSDQIGDRLSNAMAVFSATALLLVAIVTALFASLNERELRRGKGELTIIADLSTAIEQTRRPSEVLQALVVATTTKLGCANAVALCAHAGTIELVGSTGRLATRQGDDLSTVGGLVAQAIAENAPVLVRHLDPELDAFIADALPNALNLALIPMVAEGEAVAVLVVEWGHAGKRRVTRPMIDLLNNVAGRVAISLSNTFLLAEVQRLASVDGLTGLPNRRTFDTAIEREVSRSLRTGQPVSLLMLDIDHFKSVNDTHGHQVGDQVLMESAGGVINACRGEDLPARYGGEEIVVIMPNCTAEQAQVTAERIRRALTKANVTLPVTASAGVATFPLNADDVTGLLAAADEALYRSKANGRNRTTMSTRTGSLAQAAGAASA